MATFISLGILVLAGTGVGLYFYTRWRRSREFYAELPKTLYLVRIPKDAPKEGADFKSEIQLTEQLLSGLTSLRAPFALEVAVPHVGEEIHFYIAVPKKLQDIAAKQIQALWSGASVEEVPDDYTIFGPEGAAAGVYLLLRDPFALPIRTYAEVGGDTFASILGGLTKVSEVGEGIAMQIVVRPADPAMRKTVKEKLEALQKGQSLRSVLGNESGFKFSDVQDAFKPSEKNDDPAITDQEAIKALTAKATNPLFETNIRLVAAARSPLEADNLLEGFIAGFGPLTSPGRNEFKFVKPRHVKKLAYQFSFRSFDPAQSMILGNAEIASLYHFPISASATPRIKWLKSKEAPPPADLPVEGTCIGESVFRGQTRKVYIADEDRRRHVYIVGQTGTGKSTLLANMIVNDIAGGKGVAVIDPHGDLVETALKHVPAGRADDVILFDPADLWRPLGLNMLDYNPDRPEEKTFIVNEMQGIFNKLFPPETMGPMFEQYMRNALLLLMEDMHAPGGEPATLVEVPRIFTDPAFRARKLARISNSVVIDFWEREAVKAGGEASLANMTPYITSKFNNFIANDYMRPIIGQPKSAFNFRSVMDEGKILLVNLSKGRIGDINANLLGMIVTGKLLMAALSRIDVAEAEKRRDFNLYVDEFQNFTTDSIATILSEARKYRLNLAMAHQFVAQLTEKIRDAVFGNVGSQIVLRVGVQDAEFLVKQFEPVFNENDLINIDNMNAYVKILVRGETTKPFNIRVLPDSWAPGDKELAERIKERSRAKYGMDRQEIEEGIKRRLRE